MLDGCWFLLDQKKNVSPDSVQLFGKLPYADKQIIIGSKGQDKLLKTTILTTINLWWKFNR